MAEFHESELAEMSPLEGDGVNRDFFTPTPYKAGSIRVFVNGQPYVALDERKGWIEISSSGVRMDTVPRTGDVMQAFYQAKDAAEVLGLEDVRGSPYSPTEFTP